MKKKIFRSFFLLITFSTLLVAAGLLAVYYSGYAGLLRTELRESATRLRDTLPAAPVDMRFEVEAPGMRLTMISPDGKVLYDSAEVEPLPGHADREEVREAMETGVGESTRLSATMGQISYYYAVKLDDGSILRLSKAIRDIWDVLDRAWPMALAVLLLVLLLGYLLAGRLTKRIVKPLNEADPTSELATPYEELTPFVRAIARQRELSKENLSQMEDKSRGGREIIGSMREGVVLLDSNGIILDVNQSALALFDGAPDVVGTHVLNLFREAGLIDDVKSALAGQSVNRQIDCNGRIFHAFMSPVSSSGCIVLFVDVTDRVNAEENRKMFSANVSHELKTPLSAISGYARQVADGTCDDEETRQLGRRIFDESARLLAVIEDVIALSALDERGSAPDKERLDVTALAARAKETLMPIAEKQHVTIVVPDNPVSMIGNRQMLYDMLLNLMDNSVKYNQTGGFVRVEAAARDNRVFVVVSDTGIGIPAAQVDRVFERFYRVDRRQEGYPVGTGLGLAIVKHIAMVHGGAVRLKSREGEGTTVVVEMQSGEENHADM